MTPSAPVHETVYSGPPLEARPPRISDPAVADLEQVECDLNVFIAHVFAWIAGALAISAFFASYSDRWEADVPSLITGQALFFLVGGMFVLAFIISRKVGNMLSSVAIATLVAYAAMQGALFGLTYRAAYHESLAPAYLSVALVFGLLSIYGLRWAEDLTSIRNLLIGAAGAMVVATISEVAFDLPAIMVCVACVSAWLMLALVGYHRDFLRDLPSTFEDDALWRKAAAVGALQIYLDLAIVVVIVIQARWLRQFFSENGEDSSKN